MFKKSKMNLLQDLNKGNYEEFVTLNVDPLGNIPTVIDDEKANKDKLMPPDSTKTGNFTKLKIFLKKFFVFTNFLNTMFFQVISVTVVVMKLRSMPLEFAITLFVTYVL